MSDTYTTGDHVGDPGTGEPSGKVDTAKHEAGALTETARDKASGVVETAKDEAKDVVREAKSQARSLYAQTKRELSDQASTQQQRVAAGLRDVSDELDQMAAGASGGGLASELVRQASQRTAGAASWLGDRDPAGVLDEVKRFARRRPAVFIAGAAIAGVIVGRLTRALASEAADDHPDATSRSASARNSADLVGAYETGGQSAGEVSAGAYAAQDPFVATDDVSAPSADAYDAGDQRAGVHDAGDATTGNLRREARSDVRPDSF